MANEKNTVLEFGQELINARKYKNMSIDQISDITKISSTYLTAMEEGQWDVLPKPYMEVFLKAYAEAVGMNVPKVMKKYREMVCQENGDRPVPEEITFEKEIPTPPEVQPDVDVSSFEKRTNWWPWVIGGGVVIVIAILLAVFLSGGKEQPVVQESKPVINAQEEAKPPAGTEESTPTSTSHTPANENLTEAKPNSQTGFSLAATAREQCWLHATIDRKTVRDVLLDPEDVLTLNATDEIHLVVGNAGGLQLKLGDEVLDSLGPSQKPVTLVIGPDGIQSQRVGAWHVNYSHEIQNVPGDSSRQSSGVSQ